jgi:hypothetical protein
MTSCSVLANNNKESWLVVEKDNVIRVFTNKNSAVKYKISNKDKVVSVLHRYSDGTMQPLLNWPDETLTDNEPPSFEQVYGELDNLDDYEENVDFYELCASNDSSSTPEEPNNE